MKKVLLGLIILIVLSGLGGYYYVGMVAERDLQKSVAEINVVLREQAQQGGALKLSLENYDRGIFNSSADMVVSMDIQVPRTPGRPAMRMPSLSYPIKLDIAHGPFIFKTQQFGIGYAKAMIAVPDKMKKMAKMVFTDSSTMPKMEVDWYLNFNADSDINFTVPEFMLEARGGKGTIDWKGFDTVVHVTDNGHKVKGYSLMNGIDGHAPNGRLSVGKVRMDYDMQYSPYKLWLGDATFKLPTLTISTGTGKSILGLSDFNMKSSATVNNALLNMGLESSLGKCVIMGNTYGPGQLDLSFSGFHAQTFSDLQAKLQAINNPAYSQAQREQMLMALAPDVLKMVSGAVVELRKFNVNIPHGTIEANAKLTAPKGEIKVKDPIQLMSQFQFTTHISMPKSLVKMALVSQAESKIEENQMILKQNKLNNSLAHDETSSGNSNNNNTSSNEIVAVQSDSQQDQTAQDSQNATQQASSDTLDETKTILTKDQVTQLAEKKADAQLSKLLAHQFLKEQGNNYVVDVLFDKGHLTVNGQDTSPSMLEQ